MSFADAYDCLLAACVMEKQELIAGLKGLGAGESPGTLQDGSVPVPVVVSGQTVPSSDPFRWLEESGARVVGDDLDIGSRSLSVRLAAGDDPLGNIVRGYLGKVPAPSVFDPDRIRAKRVLDLARLAKGVAFIHQRFCEPLEFDLPDLRAELKKVGVACVELEVEGASSDTLKLRELLATFLEVARGGP